METWIPLISAVVGAGLALLGVFINNIFQAKQRKEDREEQRREAKIQDKKKWIERDILAIMDAIDKTLKSWSVVNNEYFWMEFNNDFLKTLQDRGIENATKYVGRDFEALHKKLEDVQTESSQTNNLISKLVHSFEMEFSTESRNFLFALNEYFKVLSNYQKPAERQVLWINVVKAAGEFQKTLREKLISIRDEQI